MTETVSVKLIAALDGVWTKIRDLHPEVPEVVLLPAPSPKREMNVLGHFAALRWRTRQQADFRLHEVVVVAEHLDRSPEEVAETLIHEAAHALNFERGVSDCSRSQYHNRKFRAAAEELGLEVEQMPHYGFALTRMTVKARAVYAEEITRLGQTLAHRWRPVDTGRNTGKSGGDDEDRGDNRGNCRNLKAVCGCPFIIRVSRKTLAETDIRCERCGQLFIV